MKKIVAGIMLIFLSTFLYSEAGAEVSVSLRLDRAEATLVDTVCMEISVTGSRNIDATPVLHGLETFLVSKGKTSSRVEIINGKVNSGLTYTYFIQPQKTGTFKIGPAEIKVDGRMLESNIVTLVVKTPSKKSRSEHEPVFIEASISSHDIYIGEQALYTLKLYQRVNINDLSLNLPEIEHIVFKQLGQPLEYQTTYAEMAYQVLEIRYSLFASKEGKYIIGPSKMNMTVRRRESQSLFDDFFKDPFFKTPFSTFSSSQPLTLATNPLELKVIPLPLEEKPKHFSGLVGNFRLESKLEPTKLKAGESATLTVQISGKGNVNRIPDIDLPEILFAKIYSDQPVLETEQDAHGIRGTKTMKWALVPEKPGQFKIPVLTLSFFNPETEKYNILHTPVHTLSVLPGKIQEEATFHSSPGLGKTTKGPVKKEVQQVGKDILPIHTAVDNLSIPYQALSTGWRFWLSLTGPLSIYLILLGSSKLRKQSPERLSLSKSRNAFKALKKQLLHDQPACSDLIDLFKGYLNDRFSLSIATLTADDAAGLLLEQGVKAGTAKKIRSLIQRIETAVYTGENFKHTEAANDLLELVKVLEKEIR